MGCYDVAVAMPDATEIADFVIYSQGEVVAEALLRDLHPTISTVLTYQLAAVAEAEVSAVAEAVASQAQDALRKQGYIT